MPKYERNSEKRNTGDLAWLSKFRKFLGRERIGGGRKENLEKIDCECFGKSRTLQVAELTYGLFGCLKKEGE